MEWSDDDCGSCVDGAGESERCVSTIATATRTFFFFFFFSEIVPRDDNVPDLRDTKASAVTTNTLEDVYLFPFASSVQLVSQDLLNLVPEYCLDA